MVTGEPGNFPGKLHVQFAGEPAAGDGLRREWFEAAVAAILNPELGNPPRTHYSVLWRTTNLRTVQYVTLICLCFFRWADEEPLFFCKTVEAPFEMDAYMQHADLHAATSQCLMLTPCASNLPGLFKKAEKNDQNDVMQPNQHSGLLHGAGHLSYFALLGRIAGLALFHGENIPAPFANAFIKATFGYPIEVADLESVEPDIYNGYVKSILDGAYDWFG